MYLGSSAARTASVSATILDGRLVPGTRLIRVVAAPCQRTKIRSWRISIIIFTRTT